MKKVIFAATFLFSVNAQATANFVSVQVCPNILFGKTNQEATQNKVNEQLRGELRKRKIKAIYHIAYTDTQSLMRDKSNSCTTVTAWIDEE
jgi:hypothetical protein